MKILIILIASIALVSCNNSKNNGYEIANLLKPQTEEDYPGKKLMETNCYVCHSPTANQSDRIGPPMIAIKKHYIDSDTSKEEFIASIQAWIKNPNKEDAKMFGAVKRFGVMPKQPFPEETIKVIADYMFDNKIEQPVWFEDHFKNRN